MIIEMIIIFSGILLLLFYICEVKNPQCKPSDIQQMTQQEFYELCKALDNAPTKPNYRCYCPYCKKGRMNDK